MDLDPELVRKALAQQPDGGMISIQRADGSGALVSRAVAEWLISTSPAPSQADVETLFDGATRARVVKRHSISGAAPADTAGEIVYADVSDPGALAELQALLKIEDLKGHLMSPADLTLEVSGPEGTRATIGIVALGLIRWERWRTDAQLLTGWALVEWIAKHGSDVPLREARERAAVAERNAAKAESARSAWEIAMPGCLRDVWPRMVDAEALRQGHSDFDVSDAVAALRTFAEDDVTPALRELLIWAGCRLTHGSGWVAEELGVMRIVRCFATDDDLVRCMTAAPTSEVVAGAARFLDWHRSESRSKSRPTRARRRLQKLADELDARLRDVCPALAERPRR